jgi:hypothetical protein
VRAAERMPVHARLLTPHPSVSVNSRNAIRRPLFHCGERLFTVFSCCGPTLQSLLAARSDGVIIPEAVIEVVEPPKTKIPPVVVEASKIRGLKTKNTRNVQAWFSTEDSVYRFRLFCEEKFSTFFIFS